MARHHREGRTQADLTGSDCAARIRQPSCCLAAACPRLPLQRPFRGLPWIAMRRRPKKNRGGTVMSTRRDFLKTVSAALASSIVFCGCGLLHCAEAQEPARQTLPVKVAGKTIKTID